MVKNKMPEKSEMKFATLDRVNFITKDGDKIRLQVLSGATWNFDKMDWEYCCMSELTYEKVYVFEKDLEIREYNIY